MDKLIETQSEMVASGGWETEEYEEVGERARTLSVALRI